MSGAWILRFAPRPYARGRLFCFSHAGVGAAPYRLWAAGLPPELELCAIQLPGRANRLNEPPLDSIPAIVTALVVALRDELDGPFAFFGHSMGAIIASETARALTTQGIASPHHLFVSGRRPPHVPDSWPPMHRLSDAAFVAEINRRYGGIPAEVLEHRDLMELLLPSLRADITALETYQPSPAPSLPCPISALGGIDDPFAPREHLEAWRSETRSAFRVQMFPGGHFYLEPRRDEVLADVVATLSAMLAGPAPKEAAA